MLEFIGAKHRGWMGGFGMNGLWAVCFFLFFIFIFLLSAPSIAGGWAVLV